jgi:homogentisate 1,2-dioxygenase
LTPPETLEKVSIHEHARQLSEPFTMIDLAHIDDLVLSLYLCQGTMAQHRHMDQDELFLVHSGTISLDSEWGTAILRPGELVVAPKGVGHRSSSLLRSLVLLLQPRLMVNRRNGHRRLFALQNEGHLEKVSVLAMGRQIATAFRPIVLAHLDTYALNLLLCEGTSPWWQTERQATLVMCYDGRTVVDTEMGLVSLRQGEMVVVPRGLAYRLSCIERTLVLGIERHEQPGLPLAG